ncbi:MAG: PH domain-containing protein [Methanosarcinales archaeon]|jgi:membrane protein YdbS with pleckstrin-like domain|nr:PH domain-containing protein [Methanosarcinales archaeon]
MKFKSKIDWWMHLAFLGMLVTNAWFIILYIQQPDFIVAISTLFILLLNVFLIMPIWLNTYYTLGESELLVKSGLLIGTKIEYGSIQSVKETRNPLASAALSLDRIEIKYGKGGIALISPKNKQEFLSLLKTKIEQRRMDSI